jgi:hypothetical protein
MTLNNTIFSQPERRSGKGRKEREHFSAAFAAFAFQRSVNCSIFPRGSSQSG